MDGYLIYRYRLERIVDAPDSTDWRGRELPDGNPEPGRRASVVQRVIRQTEVARRVKELHDYVCQICGQLLMTAAGPYAEAAHIQPLGRPHDGPDVSANVLCLCPNHHVLFDKGAITIQEDLQLVGVDGTLRTTAGHELDPVLLEYHRNHIFERANEPYAALTGRVV